MLIHRQQHLPFAPLFIKPLFGRLSLNNCQNELMEIILRPITNAGKQLTNIR